MKNASYKNVTELDHISTIITPKSRKIRIFDDLLTDQYNFPKSGYWGGRIRFNIVMNIAVIGLAIIPFLVPPIFTVAISLLFGVYWVISFLLYLFMTIRLKSNHK